MDLLEAMKVEQMLLEEKLKQLKNMIATYGGTGSTATPKRRISAKTRAKMKAAAKKRWAEKKKAAA